MPFMVRWPGHLPEGVVEDRPVISLDIAATALALAGAKSEQPLDGVNLVPFLSGDSTGRPHEEFYWRQGQRIAVRVGDRKLLRNDRRNADAWELYDLADDIGEINNLIDQMADRTAALRELLERMDDQMVERAF